MMTAAPLALLTFFQAFELSVQVASHDADAPPLAFTVHEDSAPPPFVMTGADGALLVELTVTTAGAGRRAQCRIDATIWGLEDGVRSEEPLSTPKLLLLRGVPGTITQGQMQPLELVCR